MNIVEPRYCQECGEIIKRTDRKMKRCQSCISAQISKTKAENLANGVTFSYPPHVPEQGFMYMLRFDSDLCKIGRTINLANRLTQYRTRFRGCNYFHTFPAFDTHKAEDYFRSLYRRERDLDHGIEWYWLDISDIEWFQSIQNQNDLTQEIHAAREKKFYSGGFGNLQEAWLKRIGYTGRVIGRAPYTFVDGKVVAR